MTKDQAVKKLLAWASQQIGYHEGANNYNKYADGMDGAYGWHIQNQPWCDIFVDVGFISCFGQANAAKMTYQPVGGFSAGCAVSAGYYQQNGAFTRTPEPGDQVFFYSNGGINHTGIVSGYRGGTVTTIEGNSADSVAERTYSVSDSRIAGYGRPLWSVVAGESEEPSEEPIEIETCSVTIPIVKDGSTGAAVAACQAALKHLGFDPVWIDGEAGPKTETAIQDFQNAMGLTADGICGAETWAALMRG